MKNCLILIDKPLNLTSNQVLQSIRRKLKIKKAGLVGVLDPLATGMLLVVIGEATKFSKYIEDMTKEYIVTIRLGYKSSTGDDEGVITKDDMIVPNFSRDHINKILSSFLGDSYQIPPMHSSVKHNGKKLYYYARKGIKIERESRKICISKIGLLKKNMQDLEIIVRCSKGTYVRTLVEDIGLRMGISAYTKSLRRIGVGMYAEDRMVPYNEIIQGITSSCDCIVELSEMLAHINPVKIMPEHEKLIKNGAVIDINLQNIEGNVLIKNINNKVIGIGNAENNQITPKRLINFE